MLQFSEHSSRLDSNLKGFVATPHAIIAKIMAHDDMNCCIQKAEKLSLVCVFFLKTQRFGVLACGNALIRVKLALVIGYNCVICSI